MATPREPLFDPLGHPGRDRTVAEWDASAPDSYWWVSAVAYALARGESRVLLSEPDGHRLQSLLALIGAPALYAAFFAHGNTSLW